MTRPALADVLAVVTTCDDATWWRDRIAAFGAPSLDAVGACCAFANTPTLRRWTRATPADALAALVEAELLPAQWSDPERAPRWWCERCAGVGRVTLRSIDGSGDLGSYAVTPDAYGDLRCDAFDVSGAPPCGAPPSLPALVAVASLGVDTLARAEAIVAEAWRARVVWRVMRRVDLEAQLAAALFDAAAPVACLAASALYRRPDGPVDAYAARVDVRPIRALAALDLHLVALADGRVNLGVEALP